MIEGYARLLEVMIITEKKKALLILGGKLYSRLLSSDEHYEKTVSVNKENTLESSLRSIDTRCIPTRDARIFVEKPKLQEAKRLMQETTSSTDKQKLLYPLDEFSQLRQVRSKFDRPSTYLRYRFTLKYTNETTDNLDIGR
ncbi:hypothetical protein BDC45DRAFT_532787 [Circinella umbellata]|nr:hypothetical protein BDC45DRAFT_532787 [Circinella umbellata]